MCRVLIASGWCTRGSIFIWIGNLLKYCGKSVRRDIDSSQFVLKGGIELSKIVNLMTDSTIHFLRDLIAINSVNSSLVPEAAGEKEIATAIAEKLRLYDGPSRIEVVAAAAEASILSVSV